MKKLGHTTTDCRWNKIVRNISLLVGSMTITILLFTILVLPIITRDTQETIISDGLQKKTETTGDSNNWWIYPELETNEIFRPPSINFSKFWQVFKQHTFWSLEAKHPVSGEWIDATELLDINRSYDNNTCKIGLNFTTPDNGYTLDWRMILAIDYKLRQFLNRSGDYEYTLSIEKNNFIFNVTFNWSDMMQYQNLTFNHGVKTVDGEKYFWWRVRKNQIKPNKYVELDPSYEIDDADPNDCRLPNQRRPLVRDSTGMLWCSYWVHSVFDVYIANSSNDGVTWDTNTYDQMDSYNCRDGTLTVGDDDIVHLVFLGFRNGNNFMNVRYTNSTDWNNVKNVTSETEDYVNGTLASAIDSNNTIHITGEDAEDAGDGEQVFYVNITDNGGTIGTKQIITATPQDDDEYFLPVIACDNDDNPHLVYTIEDGGANPDDLAHTMSRDNGDTWDDWDGDIIIEGQNNDAHRSPGIMINESGYVVVSWYHEDTINSDYGHYEAVDDSAGWEIYTIEADGIQHRDSAVSCVASNGSHYIASANYSIGDMPIEMIANHSGTWTDWEVIASPDALKDLKFPCSINSQHPTISGVQPCIPETGYALVYVNYVDNTLMYLASADLTWQTPVEVDEWQQVQDWNTTLVNNTFNWQQIQDWNITLVNETLNWLGVQDWNVTLVNETLSWNTVQDWNITLSNTSVNNVPYQGSEFPTNNSSGVGITPQLSVICYDDDTSDTLNATWWANTYMNTTIVDENCSQYNETLWGHWWGRPEVDKVNGTWVFLINGSEDKTMQSVLLQNVSYCKYNYTFKVEPKLDELNYYAFLVSADLKNETDAPEIYGGNADKQMSISHIRDGSGQSSFWMNPTDWHDNQWHNLEVIYDRNYTILRLDGYVSQVLTEGWDDGVFIGDYFALPEMKFAIGCNSDGENNTIDWNMTVDHITITTGEWWQFASNETSFANNTNITQTCSAFNQYNTTYLWSVNLTDGEGGWNNETYMFTTEETALRNWQNIQTWNTTLVNNTFNWQQIQDWNITLVNETFNYNNIQDWNTTLVNNTFSWSAIQDWNVTLVNQTFDWNLIQNWNITLVNQTFNYNQIQDWNITLVNLTKEWTNIQDWNITLVNGTQNWQQVQDWNITLVNTSSYTQIQDWNITLVNKTQNWQQIQDWNITLVNETLNWLGVQDWNITLSNNTFLWNNIQDWNITIVNLSREWTNIQDWNITITNSNSWTQIQNWNLTISNSSIDPMTISNVYPANHSINIPLQPTMYLTINHTTDETMNISWYYGSEGNENILLGIDSNILNSTQSQLNFNASSRTTDYYWRIMVDDGTIFVNYTYTFQTEGLAGGGSIRINQGIIASALLIGLTSFGMISLYIFGQKRKRR